MAVSLALRNVTLQMAAGQPRDVVGLGYKPVTGEKDWIYKWWCIGIKNLYGINCWLGALVQAHLYVHLHIDRDVLVDPTTELLCCASQFFPECYGGLLQSLQPENHASLDITKQNICKIHLILKHMIAWQEFLMSSLGKDEYNKEMFSIEFDANFVRMQAYMWKITRDITINKYNDVVGAFHTIFPKYMDQQNFPSYMFQVDGRQPTNYLDLGFDEPENDFPSKMRKAWNGKLHDCPKILFVINSTSQISIDKTKPKVKPFDSFWLQDKKGHRSTYELQGVVYGSSVHYQFISRVRNEKNKLITQKGKYLWVNYNDDNIHCGTRHPFECSLLSEGARIYIFKNTVNPERSKCNDYKRIDGVDPVLIPRQSLRISVDENVSFEDFAASAFDDTSIGQQYNKLKGDIDAQQKQFSVYADQKWVENLCDILQRSYGWTDEQNKEKRAQLATYGKQQLEVILGIFWGENIATRLDKLHSVSVMPIEKYK